MFSTTIPSSALMAFLGTLLIGKWGSVAHLCMSYGKQAIVKVSIPSKQGLFESEWEY